MNLRIPYRLLVVIAVVAIAFVSFAGRDSRRGSSDPDAVARAIIDQTNAFRKSQGLKPLGADSKLMAAAQKHAENMAKQSKMSHELDGKSPWDRIKAEKYSFTAAAENVATERGAKDPATTAVTCWKNSPGHRANMLSTKVTEIGVGAAQGKNGAWYFCQDFGRPR